MYESRSFMTYTKGEFSEKHQQAIRLFESGLGYKRVATALQLKPYTVRDWARNWRFHVRANREARPEDRGKAVAMRQQGASLMEIVAEMKMSKRTILSWLTAEQAHEDWNAVGQTALRETSDVVHLATN